MKGFPSDLFAGSRFAVLGLGRNGAPAACALAAMGAEVVAWDDDAAARDEHQHTSPATRERSARASAPGVGAAFVGAAPPRPSPAVLAHGDLSRIAGEVGSLSLADLATGPFDFDALILSPGIPHALPAPHPVAARARAAGVPILSDAELLFQAVRRVGSRAQFVGITGTNGKSTTTALLAHMLGVTGRQVAAGGNLGPASLALPLLDDDGIYVLEMSSYMLERLATLRFDAAAMLNISADHLDRHAGMPGYLAAKRAVFDRQITDDVAVVGVDDPDSRKLAIWLRTRPARVLTISGQSPADIWCDAGILRDTGGPILDIADAPALPGTHNAQNAAAAAAIGVALGLTRKQAADSICTFSGLPHRQQRVGCHDGVVFINDSKATNADATARALACYDRLVWIAGGIAKAGGIASLAPFFPRIAHAVLIGRDAPALATTLADAGVSHAIAGTLDHAVPAAFAAARRTGTPVVLLSPACASFDQFSGFDARGERFGARTAALAHEVAA